MDAMHELQKKRDAELSKLFPVCRGNSKNAMLNPRFEFGEVEALKGLHSHILLHTHFLQQHLARNSQIFFQGYVWYK
jgi:hypothetical protein